MGGEGLRGARGGGEGSREVILLLRGRGKGGLLRRLVGRVWLLLESHRVGLDLGDLHLLQQRLELSWSLVAYVALNLLFCIRLLLRLLSCDLVLIKLGLIGYLRGRLRVVSEGLSIPSRGLVVVVRLDHGVVVSDAR
mgnify:CR=1 FL=1